MNFRHHVFIISMLFFASCNFFSRSETNKLQAVDTVVNFTKVDASPAFEKCKNRIDEARTNCFRKEMYVRVANSLQEYSFITEKKIDEEVFVDVLINNEGSFVLKNITASKSVTEQLPKLDSIIKSTIAKLPQIQPAIKRGIPVATQYQLPLKIKTKEI